MYKLVKQVRRLVLFIADIIFPIECLGCGAAKHWLCATCLNSLSWRWVQTCPSCLKPNLWGEYCNDCYLNLDGIIVAGSYEDRLLKHLIKAYKYRFAKALAVPLANFLIMFVGHFLSTFTVLQKQAALPQVLEHWHSCLLIPVPLSRRRQAWRGFNQAELLAKNLGSYYGLAVNCSQLQKIKDTKPQAGLKKTARQSNLSGCFAWQGPTLNQASVILIDDLATTGSTLQECARVLKQAGANEVWGLVLAKN